MTEGIFKYGFAILILEVAFFINAYSQTTNNSWLRGTLRYEIDERLNTDIEFQHRRQSGLDSKVPFKHDLLLSFRNWTGYRFNKELKLSVSPFGYFRHYKLVNDDGPFRSVPSTEKRFSIALLWQKNLGKGFQFVNRGAAEYRIFDNRTGDIFRMRDRLGIRYGLVDKLSVMVYNELLVNAVGRGNGNFVDHNRIGAQMEYTFLPQFVFRLGYLYIDRLPLNGETWLQENNMSLNLTYNLQRRKKNSLL